MVNNDKENFNSQDIIKRLWDSKKKGLLLSAIFAMLFFIVSAVIPPSYKAFSSVAINQQRTAGIDAYREAKSSEFMARTVKEMIMANSFMHTVLNDNEISWPAMNKIKTQDEKIKYWKKKVKVSVIPNTGVLSILVYTRDRELSKQLLIKILDSLRGEKGTFFAKKGVTIEIINEPYFFHKQATPNILLNTILGFIVGLVVFIIIILFEQNTQSGRSLKLKSRDTFLRKRKNKRYTELSAKEIELFNKTNANFNFK